MQIIDYQLDLLTTKVVCHVYGNKHMLHYCYVRMYFSRYRSRVRGLFSAITSPTSIGPLIVQRDFQEKIFLCKYNMLYLYVYFLNGTFNLMHYQFTSVCPDHCVYIIIIAVLHKLINSRQLHGSLHGHGDKALYIPEVYIHMQNKWSDSFLSSNGYLGM